MATSLDSKLRDVQALLGTILEEARGSEQHLSQPLGAAASSAAGRRRTSQLDRSAQLVVPRAAEPGAGLGRLLQTDRGPRTPAHAVARAKRDRAGRAGSRRLVGALSPVPGAGRAPGGGARPGGRSIVSTIFSMRSASAISPRPAALIDDDFHAIEAGEEVDKPKFINALSVPHRCDCGTGTSKSPSASRPSR